MSRVDCQANCGRPAGSGFICSYCLNELRSALGEIPFLMQELETVITRQAVYSVRYGHLTRSTITPLPFHAAASVARANLENFLVKWTVKLVDTDCPLSPRAEHVATWMLGHIDHYRNHYQAGQLTLGLVGITTRSHWLIDRPPDRWYAGPCPCGRQLYTDTGSTGHFVCDHCGAEHDARTRRDIMLREAENHLANAVTVARAVTWLGGIEVSPKRIGMWVQRKRLVAKGHEPYATPTDPARTRPLYRIGDVLDLIADTTQK